MSIEKEDGQDELSLIIIKPDARRDGLVEEIERRLNNQNLIVTEQKEILIDLEFLKKFYRWPVILYPRELEEYLCNLPLLVWVVKGNDAIKKALELKIEIRSEFQVDELHTLIHCPDSRKDFEYEYSLVFTNQYHKGENK